MKSFKIESSLALIPGLAAILLALLGVIVILSFFSSTNIANSESFRLSSSSPSPLQSQQEQQKLLNTNGISITKNLNEQQTFHQPFPISLQSSTVRSLLSQQQQNPPPWHQEQQQNHQHSNGINYRDKSDNYLATMAYPIHNSQFPEPLCYFNIGPIFCPHYLWTK